MFRVVVFAATLASFLFSPAATEGLFAQGIATIQSGGLRPFVTGVTPVIGPNGGVGGILVDTDGVVQRPAKAQRDTLAAQRSAALKAPDAAFAAVTPLRYVSLARLNDIVRDCLASKKPIPQEVFFLAGLQRVEYVFALPEIKDLVIAGPAESWLVDESGAVVGLHSRRPPLRLDDLVEAFRSVKAAQGSPISCSIEPSPEGQNRFAELINNNRLTFSAATVKTLGEAMGDQRVIVRGVAPESHFARVLVAADFSMKSLAMGWDGPKLDGFPSYLERARRARKAASIAAPRWWMAVNYEALEHSPDRLAWHLSGPGLKTSTEYAVVTANGQRETRRQNDPNAQDWADAMTERFDDAAQIYPVLGSLRNCVDLSVVAALITQRGLLEETEVETTQLLEASAPHLPRYQPATTIDSKASFVKGRSGWLISVSGGVEIDSWSVLNAPVEKAELGPRREQAIPQVRDRFWW